MRNLFLYFKSLLQGAVTLAVFLAAFYVSIVFFLLALFDEAWNGKENSSRISRMELLIEKLQRYAGVEESQQRKHFQVDEKLS